MALLKRNIAVRNTTLRFGYRFLLAVLLSFTAIGETIDEYQVKAAFLYNFTKFVDWPPQTFKTDRDPIRICVLGQDPFGNALAQAVAGKTVLGRALVLSWLSVPGHATECQVLFISSSERKHLGAILGALRTSAVLTVGETDGFGAQGGIVNFKLEDGRIRLEVNVEAAGRAKLGISSKVLNLAEIVKSGAQK